MVVDNDQMVRHSFTVVVTNMSGYNQTKVGKLKKYKCKYECRKRKTGAGTGTTTVCAENIISAHYQAAYPLQVDSKILEFEIISISKTR